MSLSAGCGKKVTPLGDAPVGEMQPCGEGCPDGYSCVPVFDDPQNPVFECIDDHQRYCAPCVSDEDCLHPWLADAGHRCVEVDGGAGSFCATACKEHADCPMGAYCSTMDDGRSICLPENETCECTDWALENGSYTTCFNVNDNGTCSGVRTCVGDGLTVCDASMPEVESCNGHDDDCDGDVDESFAQMGVACDDSDDDQCLDGVWACETGVVVCTDDSSTRAEVCNGIDDDCDGTADEGVQSTYWLHR